MAGKLVPIEFDGTQRAWIKLALENQIRSAERSKLKEFPGSEVMRIRDTEIAQMREIIAKVSA